MAGRPKKEIAQDQFEKLCGLQCTLEEICGWFDITDKTLDRWCIETYKQHFSEVFAKKREAGKISLRRSQFRLAEKNASMAIFLGKQYLGQSDTPTVNYGNDDNTLDALTQSLREEAERLNENADQ